MKVILNICLFVLLINSCVPDEELGKALNVSNNSDERIYFWISDDYSKYHYPDTILPISKPLYINSVEAHGGAGSGGIDPNWNDIFSRLPQGKLSIYFFEEYATDQQEWEDIRVNHMVLRKNVTIEELKSNDYIIYYP
jgi:hypothetical protein